MGAGKIGTAAIAALLTTAATPAATPSEAYACKLPYKAAMQSLGALTVLEQRRATNLVYFSPMTIVTFEPKPVRLFGAQPMALSLELTEPKASDPDGKIRAEFIALLPRSEAVDEAITTGHKWHLNACRHLNLCIQADDPARDGTLELHRHNSNHFKLVCRYETTMKEIEGG